MHRFRWVVSCGWLILIASLFYDPISPWLTEPSNTMSPFRMDPTVCVKVQGSCMKEIPYAMGGPIFWGMIVPSGILLLMLFGHDLWRRICPLSFMSQIPRALKWQRQRKKTDVKTGKVRYEIVKVDKNSWLGRNSLYVQLVLFYIGISVRILFVNSDRLALGLFLIFTILSAIGVNYLYGGKSWCQYFCPMSPVEEVFTRPRALLNSTAHENDNQKITQSMCRTTNPEGKEISACIACKSSCIDIDAERSYWENLTAPKQQWLYYSYVGLTIGYFIYPFLYAGNWDYYFSGAWSHQETQLQTLLSPGFYIFDTPIPIPKLVAVPLTIGLCGLIAYYLGRKIEKRYKAYLFRHHKLVNTELVRHRMFTLCTFLMFNFFFIFGGRNYILLLPVQVQYTFIVAMAVISSLWLYRTWPRNPHLYQRESLANRLRKQLSRLSLDLASFLDGRSVDDLHADEVYVLAKILPDFDRKKRLQAYKGVLKEAVTEGYVDTSSSFSVLEQMRLELNITDEEHQKIVTELKTESPNLFDNAKPKTHEDWLRQEGYREAFLNTILESFKHHPNQGLMLELFDVMTGKKPFESFNNLLSQLPKEETKTIESIRAEYGISYQEEQHLLRHTAPSQFWQTVAYTLSIREYLEAVAQGRIPFAGNTDGMNYEQMSFCQNTFKKLDKDGNNCLSAEEFSTLLAAVGRPYALQQVQELMTLITGRSHTEGISFEEFTILLQSNLTNNSEQILLERFHLFDTDDSGYISFDELRNCIRNIEPNIPDAAIEEMLKMADLSGDQQISFEEFSELFHKLSRTSVS
ncbi:putative signal transduction protein with EFhand domain [Gloeothece citriformis PCC 7424]|uniref:Putative signal transduction protein with EFhand domain n=2 Tax=Gloeothece TaxID=28070 RepID=B7K9X3_GLOC7|nr:putative signal transduction protein with EFhand domain [Gloeothece citriformis PCC 7424]